MKQKVYIASPYFSGDQAANVKRQMDAADILMDRGYVPFVPLLAHFQHLVHPRTEKQWLEWDLIWLKTCDFIIRIKPIDKNGKEIPSPGADLEVKTALEAGLPVYTCYSLEDVKLIKIS